MDGVVEDCAVVVGVGVGVGVVVEEGVDEVDGELDVVGGTTIEVLEVVVTTAIVVEVVVGTGGTTVEVADEVKAGGV